MAGSQRHLFLVEKGGEAWKSRTLIRRKERRILYSYITHILLTCDPVSSGCGCYLFLLLLCAKVAAAAGSGPTVQK